MFFSPFQSNLATFQLEKPKKIEKRYHSRTGMKLHEVNARLAEIKDRDVFRKGDARASAKYVRAKSPFSNFSSGSLVFEPLCGIAL